MCSESADLTHSTPAPEPIRERRDSSARAVVALQGQTQKWNGGKVTEYPTIREGAVCGLLLFLLMVCSQPVCPAGAPTFQELMAPRCFPVPQKGMEVTKAHLDDDGLTVETTGAEMHWEPASGAVALRQRIGRVRVVATAGITPSPSKPSITHAGPCFIEHVLVY